MIEMVDLQGLLSSKTGLPVVAESENKNHAEYNFDGSEAQILQI
ncbi:TPA: hypothetical protein ACVTET_004469 [Salmonella enterica subsp. salamae]